MVILDIAARGSLFVARPAGERLRRWLERQLAATDDDVVGLDFRSVRAFDHTAADEAFGKLLVGIRSGLVPSKFVVFMNATEAQLEHLGWVLERRHLYAIASSRGRMRLIGKVPPGVAAVFDQVRRTGALRATALAAELGISTNAASNRLRTLWAAGILAREPVTDPLGGRAYRYKVPAGLPTRARSARSTASAPSASATRRARLRRRALDRSNGDGVPGLLIPPG